MAAPLSSPSRSTILSSLLIIFSFIFMLVSIQQSVYATQLYQIDGDLEESNLIVPKVVREFLHRNPQNKHQITAKPIELSDDATVITPFTFDSPSVIVNTNLPINLDGENVEVNFTFKLDDGILYREDTPVIIRAMTRSTMRWEETTLQITEFDSVYEGWHYGNYKISWTNISRFDVLERVLRFEIPSIRDPSSDSEEPSERRPMVYYSVTLHTTNGVYEQDVVDEVAAAPMAHYSEGKLLKADNPGYKQFAVSLTRTRYSINTPLMITSNQLNLPTPFICGPTTSMSKRSISCDIYGKGKNATVGGSYENGVVILNFGIPQSTIDSNTNEHDISLYDPLVPETSETSETSESYLSGLSPSIPYGTSAVITCSQLLLNYTFVDPKTPVAVILESLDRIYIKESVVLH